MNSADPSPTTNERSTRLPIDVRRFPGVRPLAADYVHNFGALSPFYAGDPSDRSAWTQAIQRAQAHPRKREEIVAVLARQQQGRDAPPQSRMAARSLADSRTVAIVTGQQAGLFGGPLFTLLKALTAIKLAEQVSAEHRVPAVAVFWVDAEDHDWDEVRRCTVLDAATAPHTVALPPRADADPLPVGAIKLDDSVVAVLDELDRVLPATEFHDALMADLRRLYAAGAGMTDAFGSWLERLLGERGLVVFDAADPAAKPLAGGIFARELSVPGETNRLAGRAGSDLAARGYHVQVEPHGEGPALFHLDDGRRIIRRQDDGFVVGGRVRSQAALTQELTEHPDNFSPNVLLRPVVQDTLFPTACYVTGPNELAYLGQLREVYGHFGVPMPLMYPRATATLFDSAAFRFVTKYDVPLEALQPQDEAVLNDLLKRQIPPAVEAAFTSAEAAIAVEMDRVTAALPTLDPTLEGAARSTLGRMQRDLETLHAKVIQAAKRRDETLRRQFIHARVLAFPNGEAQERAVGFVSFLNRYGPGLIDKLLQELPLDPGRHWLVVV